MKTIKDVDVKNKKVIVRADFDVPVVDRRVVDNSKLKDALPTINYLIENDAKIILISDLGNPRGHIIPGLRMDSVAAELEKLLGTHVENIDEIIGDNTLEAVHDLIPGEVLLLENLGFSGGEYHNNDELAQRLASLADIYVDDDFSIANKENASNVGITKYIPSYAGLLFEKEYGKLGDFMQNIDNPFVVILGGNKPEPKMSIIERFIDTADYILTTGMVALAFLKAQGYKTGKADISDTAVAMAKDLLAQAEQENTKIIIPEDFLVADEIKQGAAHHFVSNKEIPDDLNVVDIGPTAFWEFNKLIYDARTVLWSGPVGVYEIADFEYGTRAIAQSVSSTDARTIAAGCETGKAINKYNKSKYIDVVSKDGEVFLAYLEGKALPGIKVLENPN